MWKNVETNALYGHSCVLLFFWRKELNLIFVNFQIPNQCCLTCTWRPTCRCASPCSWWWHSPSRGTLLSARHTPTGFISELLQGELKTYFYCFLIFTRFAVKSSINLYVVVKVKDNQCDWTQVNFIICNIVKDSYFTVF